MPRSQEQPIAPARQAMPPIFRSNSLTVRLCGELPTLVEAAQLTRGSAFGVRRATEGAEDTDSTQGTEIRKRAGNQANHKVRIIMKTSGRSIGRQRRLPGCTWAKYKPRMARGAGCICAHVQPGCRRAMRADQSNGGFSVPC